MSKRVQDEKPAPGPEVQAWMKEEIADQERRYQAIADEMESIQEERNGWIADFLTIIQNKGFNVTGDIRRQIQPDEIPERPDRPDADKVVW